MVLEGLPMIHPNRLRAQCQYTNHMEKQQIERTYLQLREHRIWQVEQQAWALESGQEVEVQTHSRWYQPRKAWP